MLEGAVIRHTLLSYVSIERRTMTLHVHALRETSLYNYNTSSNTRIYIIIAAAFICALRHPTRTLVDPRDANERLFFAKALAYVTIIRLMQDIVKKYL